MGKQLFRFIGRHAQQRKSNCKSINNNNNNDEQTTTMYLFKEI